MQGKARQGKLSSVPAKIMDDVFLNQPESRAHPEHTSELSSQPLFEA